MLSPINTPLPQSPATQLVALPSSAAATGVPSAQQITAAAVPGAGGANAYDAQTSQQRAQTPRTTTPQLDRPAILPDPEFWKVPTREVGSPVLTAPPRLPVTVNLPQVTQFHAQQFAQQREPVDSTSRDDAGADRLPRRPSATGKKVGLGEVRGAGAYQAAAQRLTAMAFPPTTEPVSA